MPAVLLYTYAYRTSQRYWQSRHALHLAPTPPQPRFVTRLLLLPRATSLVLHCFTRELQLSAAARLCAKDFRLKTIGISCYFPWDRWALRRAAHDATQNVRCLVFGAWYSRRRSVSYYRRMRTGAAVSLYIRKTTTYRI